MALGVGLDISAIDQRADARAFAGERPAWQSLPVYHHAFSHFDLALQPLLVRDLQRTQIADDDRYCWYDPTNPQRIGLAKPAMDLIRQVTSNEREALTAML